MFASTLRCRITTPLGSAVAPEVKMICVTSSREIVHRRHRTVGVPVELAEAPRWTPAAGSIARRVGDVVTDEHQARLDDACHLAHEVGGRSVVDRDDDDAGDQAAPVAGDPFGPVLAPEDHLVALARCPAAFSLAANPRAARPTSCIGMHPALVAVVVDEEIAADGRSRSRKKVDRACRGAPVNYDSFPGCILNSAF